MHRTHPRNARCVGTLAIRLSIVICVWYSVEGGTLFAQSTRAESSDMTIALPDRSSGEPGKLLHDLVQQRVPINAASSVTGSTISEHEERPFRRKPTKNVFVNLSLAILIAALLVVAAILVALSKRRKMLHGNALRTAGTLSPDRCPQIKGLFGNEQLGRESEDLVEESCQTHKPVV